MSTTATGVRTISLVCLPIDRAGRSGRVLRVDRLREARRHPLRWRLPVDRGLSGRGVDRDRAGPTPAQRPGRARARWIPIQTGITLTTDDIDATHAQFTALGVDVDAEVSRMGAPVPPMFWFRDPAGHTLMVVESPKGN